jgi:hypothetical protein
MNKNISVFFLIFFYFNISQIPSQTVENKLNEETKSNENIIRTNSLYAELYGFIGIMNYGKSIEYSPQRLFTLNGGITYFDGFIVLGETTLLLGKKIHHIEPGIGFVGFQDEKFDLGYTLRLGYRYQGKKGLLLKASVLNIDGDILPALGIGYSF